MTSFSVSSHTKTQPGYKFGQVTRRLTQRHSNQGEEPRHNSNNTTTTHTGSRMDSDLECGVCYQLFNAGHRCPRELQCKHTFCQRCLRALLTPRGLILCPLCRHPTPVSQEGRVRAELRVDEGALERLLAAGLLDQSGDDDDDEEEDVRAEKGRTTPPDEPQQGGVEAFSGSRGGRLRQSWRKVWRRISGKNNQRGEDGRLLT